MILITPEELADLETGAEMGIPPHARLTLRLIATIRALTARAAAAEKERDELRARTKVLGTRVSDLELARWPDRAARLLPAEPDHGEA